MMGPKKKVMRQFLPHEPERDSPASESESSESDSCDDIDYAPAYDSDEYPNEDEWELEGSVESAVIELAAEMEHAEEIGWLERECVVAFEPARVVAVQQLLLRRHSHNGLCSIMPMKQNCKWKNETWKNLALELPKRIR